MGHFSILHYLIAFAVQFPGFSFIKKKIFLSYCGWNSEEKIKQNPTTYSIGKLKIHGLIGVVRWFRIFFCGDRQNFDFINVKISANKVLNCYLLHCIAIFPPRRGKILFLYFVLDVKEGVISSWTLFRFLSLQCNCTMCSWVCACYLSTIFLGPKLWLKAGQCFL